MTYVDWDVSEDCWSSGAAAEDGDFSDKLEFAFNTAFSTGHETSGKNKFSIG